MSPVKSKEDTWKADELARSVKSAKEASKHSRDDHKSSRRSDKDESERRHRSKKNDTERSSKHSHHDDDDTREHRSSKHRDKDDEERQRRREERRKREEQETRDRRREEHRKREEVYGSGEGHMKHDVKRHREDADKEHRRHRNHDDDKHRKHGDRADRHSTHKNETEHRTREKTSDRDENREHRSKHREGEGRDKKESTKHYQSKEGSTSKEKKSTREEPRQKKRAEPVKDEYDYDDDFEDYEDDFENEASSDGTAEEKESDQQEVQTYTRYESQQQSTEINELRRALKEENERLLNKSDSYSKPEIHRRDSSEDRYSKAPQKPEGKAFINFVSAKQSQFNNLVCGKLQRRAKDLNQLIDCDFISYSLFDHQPIKEYDTFIHNFGSSNTKQAYVQTNSDNIDRDIQTELIETREKWNQHPPEVDMLPCGGDMAKLNDDEMLMQWNTILLSRFLEKSSQVIAILLEEDSASRLRADSISSQQSDITVSDSFFELQQHSILRDRQVIVSDFSSVQTQLLLVAYTVASKISKSDRLSTKGIICVWNVNEPERPNKVLLCESVAQCCCFDPVSASLVFAGLVDGSLCVWDLREATNMHRIRQQHDNDLLLRRPTYNTAGVLKYENHSSSVVAVRPILSRQKQDSRNNNGFRSLGDLGQSSTYQIASLETNSVINFWVVASLTDSDPAGSVSDLGLTPGGKIKLIKSSQISLNSISRNLPFSGVINSTTLNVLPTNNNQYFIGTDSGHLIHGARSGDKAIPTKYSNSLVKTTTVTSVDFSPFNQPVFLVGYQDGGVSLFHTDIDSPLQHWSDTTRGRPVHLVRWIPTRPSMFVVLDAGSNLYVWDLQRNHTEALWKDKLSDAKVTSVCFSGDKYHSGRGDPHNKPKLAVFIQSGSSQIHFIKKKLYRMRPEEVEDFALLLQNIM